MPDKYASLRLKNQLCFPLYAVSNMITRKYKPLLDIVKAQGAETTKEQRKHFAERAFATSSHYDTAIHEYFAK